MNRLWLFPLVSLLASCGGGGGSSNTPVVAPTPAASTPSPVWTLQRSAPGDIDIAQGDVDAILDHVFGDQAVQAAVLVKLGYIIGERYATNYTGADLGTSWSVAKSFYSAAIGVAIDEGWITSLDQKASDLLSEWQGTNKEDITIRNMLEMRAGLPENVGVFFETDQTAYALSQGLVNTPGTTFLYSNVNSQLFELLLLRATGLSAHVYLTEKILNPIGIDMNQVGLWFDSTGVNPMTYCCIDMRAEDFARFGLLYARGGSWDGVRVISQAFVNESLTPQSAFYGLQWWVLNQNFFGTAAPVTVSAALGLNGQKIYVWPAEDVVLVVLTIYDHFQNQGYVLSATNWPDTCTARNTCPGSTGPAVPPFDEFQLINLLANLR